MDYKNDEIQWENVDSEVQKSDAPRAVAKSEPNFHLTMKWKNEGKTIEKWKFWIQKRVMPAAPSLNLSLTSTPLWSEKMKEKQ